MNVSGGANISIPIIMFASWKLRLAQTVGHGYSSMLHLASLAEIVDSDLLSTLDETNHSLTTKSAYLKFGYFNKIYSVLLLGNTLSKLVP